MKKNVTVDDAYALETPEDNIRLYEGWAKTYDSDFVDATGYTGHWQAAKRLFELAASIDGAVLDVGCGTGGVGVCLRQGGVATVDGIDISESMLAEAGKKTTAEAEPVYRNLIQADLTRTIDISDNCYAAIVSAGTFTHGHLGPESLDELWRVAMPGAHCVINIRTTFFASAGFDTKLAADAASGLISGFELDEFELYEGDTMDPDHADDRSYVVSCQVLK